MSPELMFPLAKKEVQED